MFVIDLKQVVVVDVSGILELFDVKKLIIPGIFVLLRPVWVRRWILGKKGMCQQRRKPEKARKNHGKNKKIWL